MTLRAVRRLSRISLLCTVTTSLALAGCGDDDTTGGKAGGGGPVIETVLSAETVVAGEEVVVSCGISDPGGAPVDNPQWALAAQPDTGFGVDGLKLIPTKTGTYAIQCLLLSPVQALDDTPAALIVVAGDTVATVMGVEPATMPAGGSAQATCHAVDGWGNETADATYVSASDIEAVQVDSRTITSVVPGDYTLTCVLPEVGNAQAVADFTVTPGAATGFSLRFEPEQGAYGTQTPITVVGFETDAHGNSLGDIPITVVGASPDGQHTIIGQNDERIRFASEGFYTVTARRNDNADITADAPIIIDETPPALVLTTPVRGLVENGAPTVTIAGTVSDNLGTIESLFVEDMEITLPAAGGSFETNFPIDYGLTLLDIIATDGSGLVSHVTRAVENSTDYYPMAPPMLGTDTVNAAAVVVLAQELIDDKDRTETALDDLASIMKMLIDTLDLTTLVPSPLTSFSCIGGDCVLDFDSLEFGSSSISMDLQSGYISFKVVLTDVTGNIILSMPCSVNVLCASDPLPLPGSITMTSVVIETDIYISTLGGEIVTKTENTVVEMGDLIININDPTGILQGAINAAITFIAPALNSALEGVFVGLIENQLAGLFGSVFDILRLDQEVEIPSPAEGLNANTLVIQTTPEGVDISPDRMQLRLGAMAYAKTPMRPFAHLGSLDRTGCQSPSALTFPPPAPMVIALHDDLMNELLFAIWEGGTLSMELGPEEAAGLVGDFGLSDATILVEPLLPPVFNSCDRDGNILQLGDIYVEASFKIAGQVVDLALWLQTEAALDIEVVEDLETGGLVVSLVLGELDPFTIEIVRNIGFFEGNDEGVINLFKSTLMPQLLSTVDEAATFALPKIDLGEITGLVPVGTIINIDIEQITRDKAYLTVEGGLK